MTPRAVAELVVRMADENPTWGYTRIRGALANLGRNIARNTVKRILHDHGIAPAPERNQRTPWKTFLQAHWEGLAAADLFTVEVLTLAGLRRYFVFFVIVLKTRRVHIAGIHPQPDGRWMEQMARNLTDPVDGFLRTARQLIHDRDPLYTRVFGEILTSGDVGPIRLPPKSRISTPMPSGSGKLTRSPIISWTIPVTWCAPTAVLTAPSASLSRTFRPWSRNTARSPQAIKAAQRLCISCQSCHCVAPLTISATCQPLPLNVAMF